MPWEVVSDPDEIAAAQASIGGGMGTASPAMDANARLQYQASGMPVLSQGRDPFGRLTDPKQRAVAQTRSLAAGEKELTKRSEGARGAQDQMATLAEFRNLNDAGETGGVGGWLQARLPAFMQSDTAQRMEALSAGMARQARTPGEGTISDFDAAQFLKMTGGMDKSKATNDAYIRAANAVAQSRVDRQSFDEAFLAANGTIVGADTLWQQYSKAVPLFDPKSKQFRGRPMGWQDYFSTRAQETLAGRRPAGILPKGTGAAPAPRGMIGRGAAKAAAKPAARVIDFNDLP